MLKDPNEDQDDILRANRSREKQYIFDCAFGPSSNQVSQSFVYKLTELFVQPTVGGVGGDHFGFSSLGWSAVVYWDKIR